MLGKFGDGGGGALAATSMGYSVLGGQFTRDTCKRYIIRGPEINIAATSTSVASGWPAPSFPVACSLSLSNGRRMLLGLH